ncbi:hypothetical protein [Sphingobium aromaticivastans]|uniref:hypothetical protein n=1 Tax=Sphingobium aromaticivastans TaxID=1778665 RepID=UPI00301AB176
MRRFLSILSLSTLVIANAAFAQSAVTGGHAGHHPADAATPSPAPACDAAHPCPMMKGGHDAQGPDGTKAADPHGRAGPMEDCKAMHGPDHDAKTRPSAP